MISLTATAASCGRRMAAFASRRWPGAAGHSASHGLLIGGMPALSLPPSARPKPAGRCRTAASSFAALAAASLASGPRCARIAFEGAARSAGRSGRQWISLLLTEEATINELIAVHCCAGRGRGLAGRARAWGWKIPSPLRAVMTLPRRLFSALCRLHLCSACAADRPPPRRHVRADSDRIRPNNDEGHCPCAIPSASRKEAYSSARARGVSILLHVTCRARLCPPGTSTRLLACHGSPTAPGRAAASSSPFAADNARRRVIALIDIGIHYWRQVVATLSTMRPRLNTRVDDGLPVQRSERLVRMPETVTPHDGDMADTGGASLAC